MGNEASRERERRGEVRGRRERERREEKVVSLTTSHGNATDDTSTTRIEDDKSGTHSMQETDGTRGDGGKGTVETGGNSTPVRIHRPASTQHIRHQYTLHSLTSVHTIVRNDGD